MTEVLRKLRGMDSARRTLLAEALLLLSCAYFGLRLLPFSTLRRALLRSPKLQGESVPRISWAVNAVATRLGTSCLVGALAAESMLRHHGHHPSLNLGINGDEGLPSRLDAHAWGACGDMVVTGRVANLDRYVVLS